MYIEQVNSPQDIKQFFAEQLRQLAGEIRNALLTKLSAHGGHVGPNLGNGGSYNSIALCIQFTDG